MVLKAQSSFPPTANPHLILELWADTVEKMSGGRLKIDVLPGGAVVPPFEVFDAVSKGVLDLGFSAFGYILGKHPATIPLSHGPLFGMDALDFLGWYYNGGGLELLQEFYDDMLLMNVVGFPIPADYPQALGWFRKPIKSLDDLKGIKMRIYGIGAEVLARLGVATVTLPGAEIVPALERGVIDAAEWINCVEDKKLGMQDVLNNYFAPGMHEPVTGGQLVVNKDVWNKLPPDIQEMFRVATIYVWAIRHFIQNYEAAIACRELTQEGVNIFRTPDDVLLSFLDEWEKHQQEKYMPDPFYRKVIESQRKYAEVVVPYRLTFWPDYKLAGMYYWKDKVEEILAR